jgi:phosphate uptake regulator
MNATKKTEIKLLTAALASLIGVIEEQLSLTTQSLIEQNPNTAKKAFDYRHQVIELTLQVMQRSLNLTHSYHQDDEMTRYVVTAWKMAVLLEKTAFIILETLSYIRYVNIASIPQAKNMLINMQDHILVQFNDIIVSYTQIDQKKIDNIKEKESIIRNIYNSFVRDILTNDLSDSNMKMQTLYFFNIAKNFERVSNLLRDIAETLQYQINGINFENKK